MKKLEKKIVLALRDLSVPVNFIGHEYLKTAISLCLDNRMLLYSTSRQLYHEIAQMYHSTPAGVERAIRYAIKVSFQAASPGMIRQYFNSGAIKHRPTNSQFISYLVEKIWLDTE